jgi:hypothetical protein
MGRLGCADVSAGPAFSPVQRRRSRILQFNEQRANITFRYTIASHQKSHRDIP